MFLRGRWLVGHVLVLATSVSFVMLGLWQYGRHEDKQDARRAAEAAFAEPAPDLATISASPGRTSTGDRVSVRGTYDAAGEVLLRNRVRGGEVGYDVVTPLRTTDGSAVLVDRGWVARVDIERGRHDVTAPAGTVEVRGTVHETQPLRPDDTIDIRGGRPALPRVDVEHVAEGLDYPVLDVWVTAQWQEPAPTGGQPALPQPRDTDDVNHLSYAFQWFAFAAIPLVGWPVVLVRRGRRPARRRGGILAPDEDEAHEPAPSIRG